MSKYLTLRLGFVHINILFIPTVLFSVLWGYFDMFAISFISVLLHEAAHFFSASLMRVGISYLDIHPFGVSVILKDGYINNSEKEFFIAFCGPLSSILLAFLSVFLPVPQKDYIFTINLLICTINLLPTLPLDGGRMIKSMLTYKMGILRAYNIAIRGSKTLIILLIPISVLALYVTKFNFTYVLITAFLFGNIYSEQKNITLVTLREILENPIKTDCLKRTRLFTASPEDKARKILRYISYDYYITVNISKNGRIVASLSESQIIDGLLELGITARYDDILNLSNS